MYMYILIITIVHVDYCDFYIIRLLSTAQGSLLDDEKLVNTLQSSKATAHDVQNQLEVNQKTEKEIDTAREV